MGFKMKGWRAYDKLSSNKKPDGRAGSSAFQKTNDKEDRLTKAKPLVKGEMEGTYIPKGKQSKQELINDLEDRIEFMNEDVNNGTKTRAEANKVIKELRQRLGYLKQNRTTA
tara:strand:- start:2368 stop:2703 length:336 start_codon:yes stop_codon:yes gene_type:complete